MGHVGAATAALASQSLDTSAHQIDSAEAAGEVVRDRHCEGALAIVDRANRRHTRTHPVLGLVEQWAKLLRIEACNDLTGERYTANVLIGCCDVCSTATAKRQRAFRLGQILFQPFTLFDKCHDACAGVVWRRFQRACDRANRFVTRYQPLACSLAGQGFYATHARADRTFRYNLEDADIAGRLHMRTSA